MSENERKPAPVGQEQPRTPADRVRQIQELLQAAEAQQAQPAAPKPVATPAAAAPHTAQPAHVPAAFDVAQVNPVREALAAKTSPAEAAAYAKAQASAGALFGSANDLEIVGNPWKIIPFGDSLPAVFEPKKPLASYEPVVPEKAVKTEQGLLFELGLREKAAPVAPAEKRAVLVDAQGRLAGAECKTPQDVQRLFTHASWLLPPAVTKGATWRVEAGKDSKFALHVDRPSGRGRTAELVPLNNFARPADSRGRSVDLDLASYFLDRFDAAVR